MKIHYLKNQIINKFQKKVLFVWYNLNLLWDFYLRNIKYKQNRRLRKCKMNPKPNKVTTPYLKYFLTKTSSSNKTTE